jgi:hypothetical protein
MPFADRHLRDIVPPSVRQQIVSELPPPRYPVLLAGGYDLGHPDFVSL